MRKLNNQAIANLLLLPIIPLLLIFGIISLIIILIFTGALVLTIGWGALLGITTLIVATILFYTKRISPRSAAILAIIGFIFIFISFLIPEFQIIGGLT